MKPTIDRMMNNTTFAFADLTIRVWRDAGLSDTDILEVCATPSPEADANLEAWQVAETGTVFAPALAVKVAMLEMLRDQ